MYLAAIGWRDRLLKQRRLSLFLSISAAAENVGTCRAAQGGTADFTIVNMQKIL